MLNDPIQHMSHRCLHTCADATTDRVPCTEALHTGHLPMEWGTELLRREILNALPYGGGLRYSREQVRITEYIQYSVLLLSQDKQSPQYVAYRMDHPR